MNDTELNTISEQIMIAGGELKSIKITEINDMRQSKLLYTVRKYSGLGAASSLLASVTSHWHVTSLHF